jgi:hypothetical protein
MQRILSAIFDNRRDAEGAISELVLSGFPRSAIRLGTGDPDEARRLDDRAGRARQPLDDGGGNFFHTLFGTDDSPYVSGIDGAVTHSHQVLTVVAPDLDEVERAAAIVERYGPLDIDATSATGDDPAPVSKAAWQAWARAQSGAARHAQEQPRYDSGASQQGSALSQQQAEPPGQSHGEASASRQFAGDAASQGGQGGQVDLHAMHQAAVEGFYKAQQEHPPAADADAEAQDDDTGRAMRQAQLAGERFPGDEHYDEYAPAYLYGLDMATHEQHGGKEWDEAEPALRGEWEQRHPQSAWAKFKDAVRHGWERLRSERPPH